VQRLAEVKRPAVERHQPRTRDERHHHGLSVLRCSRERDRHLSFDEGATGAERRHVSSSAIIVRAAQAVLERRKGSQVFRYTDGRGAQPWRALSIVVPDCGDGWLLVSYRLHGTFVTEWLRHGRGVEHVSLSHECEADLRFHEEQLLPRTSDGAEVSHFFVTALDVDVRAEPRVDAPIVARLGYGAELHLVSNRCVPDWLIVELPFGNVGYIQNGARLYDSTLLSRDQLIENQQNARDSIEEALWAVIVTQRFPGDDSRRLSERLARAVPKSTTKGRCDSFVGSCRVVPARVDVSADAAGREALAQVSAGPWWVLREHEPRAQLAPFVGASLRTGWDGNELGCGGQGSCTFLTVDFGLPEVVAATRRPPASWFQQVGQCTEVARLEATVLRDAKWRARIQELRTRYDAKDGKPRCLAAADGTAWWIVPLEDSDFGPSVLAAQGQGGRVVDLQHREPVMARDLDGDGRVDVVWRDQLSFASAAH